MTSLKPESWHDANTVVLAGTGVYRDVNFPAKLASRQLSGFSANFLEFDTHRAHS